MTSSAAPENVEGAVDVALGALLRDRDVSELGSLEGGMLQVMRRGRRERLDSILEGPLFSLLRDALEAAGVGAGVLRLRLRGGHELTCAALVDGRLALRLVKAPSLEARLELLVEEGLLPPGIPEELVAAVLAGGSVLVLGPSRAGRQRLATAVVRALQVRLAFFGLTDGLGAVLPVPRAHGDVVERACDAMALGADALCALELSSADLARLARTPPGVPLVASVAASTMDAVVAALAGTSVTALAALSAVVGQGPEGQPRLLELHGGPGEGAATGGGASERDDLDEPTSKELAGVRSLEGAAARDRAFTGGARGEPPSPREVSGLRPRPGAASAIVADDPGLPRLDDLPAAWASDAPDDDPGWELAGIPTSEPPVPGSFDAALAAQKQRPSFAPRPPQAHPQSGNLKVPASAASLATRRGLGGDPFGGLTFEPPPGGAGASDVDVDEDER